MYLAVHGRTRTGRFGPLLVHAIIELNVSLLL